MGMRLKTFRIASFFNKRAYNVFELDFSNKVILKISDFVQLHVNNKVKAYIGHSF